MLKVYGRTVDGENKFLFTYRGTEFCAINRAKYDAELHGVSDKFTEFFVEEFDATNIEDLEKLIREDADRIGVSPSDYMGVIASIR